MLTIEATIPYEAPPAWALLERQLFAIMDKAVAPFIAKYTLPDGTLRWRDADPSNYGSRDGGDDFYESFYNWPLVYLLGGGEHLLALAHRHWEAVTKQLTAYGLVQNEYERGYDQFHQSEGALYFYFLCLADPSNAQVRARAQRFAGLFMDEDPDAPNYDPEHRLIRAPHNGSAGPRPGINDGEPIYGWSRGMTQYGLPFEDVPGIATYDDLQDPALARRMGAVMAERMGRGDVPVNLAVTSLVTNAYLLTGEERYRRWVLDYVDAWRERAEANGGLLPDNVGLSGQIGEYTNGKWYGGLYGWTWPHGYYTIGGAATVAASNALLLTRDQQYLDFAREQVDQILARGERRDRRTLTMSLAHHWVGEFAALDGEQEVFVVPYRYGDSGWFDYQPLSPIYPIALWNMSMAAADWARIEQLREMSGADWHKVTSFRGKEDAGHEQPWLRFLVGDNPDYPAAILGASYGQICRRLEQIRRDDADITKVHIHHWQNLNPLVTEALVQLTLGAPQVVYNGGLLQARVRYFDPTRQRPGLPPDVAALVERIEETRTVLQLVNLSPFETREVIVQAGAFAEHRFTTVTFPERTSDYPGIVGSYAAPALATVKRTLPVEASHLNVALPPGTTLTLDLVMARFVNDPTYAAPWAHDEVAE